jgi:hypothetical protein
VSQIPFLEVVPYLLMFITVDWPDSKVDSACVRISDVQVRTGFVPVGQS